MKFTGYLAIIVLASVVSLNARNQVQLDAESVEPEPILCVMTTPTILESVLSKLLDDEEPLVLTQEERDALLQLVENGLPAGKEKEEIINAIKKVPIKDMAQK